MNEFVRKEEENVALLEDLPTEILLVIFKYCTLRSLGNVCQTCKRLNSVVNDFIWHGRSQKALATNQISPDIQKRSSHLLSTGQKCRIAENWLRGRYVEKIYYPFKTRQLPWLVLEQDRLWLSKGKQIRALERKPDGLSQSSSITLKGHTDDVCRFVKYGDLIVSGGRDGSVCGWKSETGELQFCYRDCQKGDIAAVDVCGNVVVSGSQDGTVKTRNFLEKNSQLCIDVGDRVWSLAIQPLGEVCCIGSAAHHQIPPLRLIDLERGMEVVKLQQSTQVGAGILDIHWESSHVFLSGGYDTYLRLWDIRTGCSEMSWEDPYDCTIYTIASDNIYTILCGTSFYGRVHLWDKRQRRDVSKFFMSARRSSPVFGLSFDPCKLFAVLDVSLHSLDFSVFKSSPGIISKKYL